MSGVALIGFASWEERCRLGIEKTLRSNTGANTYLWYSSEYATWTSKTRTAIQKLVEEMGGSYLDYPIKLSEPSFWWRDMQSRVREIGQLGEPIIFDYSTCPRNALWCILSILTECRSDVRLIYYPPKKNDGYGKWLSADPGPPILIYGHSGIADPLHPTALVVTTGFDLQRTAQLYNVFEPERMVVLLQTGEQFQNEDKNLRIHLEWLKGSKDDRLSSREIDAYSPDHGYATLLECVDELAESCNVVLASLGPKLGSIGMYKVWKKPARIWFGLCSES